MSTIKKSIDERFVEFNARNPDVYLELVRLAREARQRGKRRIGIKLLVEVVRWSRTLATTGDGEFKISNDYSSRYSRLIMEREPDLAGFFTVKELTSRTDEHELEFDAPTSSSCPRCGEADGCDCWPETIKSRNGLEFEGLDSWR